MNESYINRVEAGQPVEATLDAIGSSIDVQCRMRQQFSRHDRARLMSHRVIGHSPDNGVME